MSKPNIEGTYQLVRRELPDGTIQVPPIVKGMFTYTKQFRNFSVVWQDDEGKYYSECYVARYAMTDNEYSETSEYLIVNDQIGGKGITYDLSNNTATTSQISIEGEKITIDLPHEFEKALSIRTEFEGDKLKATGKDLFIDYWEKVE